MSSKWRPAVRFSVALALAGTAMVGSIVVASQTRYTYDAKGRLTKVESDGANAAISSYAHDAADNRTNVKVSASPRVLNASFENPAIASYVYSPSAPDLTFSAGSGISRSGDAWGFPAPWDGNQVAFLQANGNQSSYLDMKAINLVPGRRYQISFAAAQRPGFPSNALKVYADGNLVWDAAPGSPDRFQAYATASFVANQSNVVIRFASTATPYDSSSGLDAVSVQPTS